MLSLTAAVFLTSCSSGYDSSTEIGGITFFMSEKDAFAGYYTWDGNENSMVIRIPNEVSGKQVNAVGGIVPRSTPLSFHIELGEYIASDIGSEAERIDHPDGMEADITRSLDFCLIYPDSIGAADCHESEEFLYRYEDTAVRYEIVIHAMKESEAPEELPFGITEKTNR